MTSPMASTSSETSLRSTVEGARLLLTCGPGGVGKTTTAAALGYAAAAAGRRTVVVTVDPARRLADSLGIGSEIGESNDPHRVLHPDIDAGGGELWALMLDAEQTFDLLIREQAGTDRQAEAVLNNPVYRAISSSLAGAQEYMAIEKLHQLQSSGEWDLIIVDTPPSRHAIDLLEAPDRLVNFLSHPVYRALTVGQRTFAKITDAAASMFLWAVKRLAGPQIVQDTVNFFRSLANLEAGLRQRAAEVSEELRAPDTAFVVVSSPRAEAVGEAEHLIEALGDRGFPFAGLVINLVHPTPTPLDDDDRELLRDLEDGPLADHVAWHAELSALAAAERVEIDNLEAASNGGHVVEVPLLDVDVNDLDGLAEIARLLTG